MKWRHGVEGQEWGHRGERRGTPPEGKNGTKGNPGIGSEGLEGNKRTGRKHW
ncbi:hypothetical protein BJX96DRAFT_145126 [Aspergillus floccosus]